MTDPHFWIRHPSSFDGLVNLMAGQPGGWFVPIEERFVDLARTWERACEAAVACDDRTDAMSLLCRYVRPLMFESLKKVKAL